ncbi:MAG: D-alanyl-D-alanine carboxypeptidase family protein [Clostridiales Family XIII bacterium]|jgi:D-alanyl-D-alanine dipeptidase/carboxypeptidase|nr:D-alanyl-D-alanine carboxypeptidase family protein [Clostridiales Family XIII bacterium]
MTGNPILVNAYTPIEDDEIEDLVSVPVPGDRFDVKLRAEAAEMLALLLHDADAEGSVIPVSGYRTHEEQERVWNESVSEYGEAFTIKYVARPDHSEHQTGLAIDLAANRNSIDFVRPAFPEDDAACLRVREKAAEYGFIVRYGKDKERITGIAYEPWHFRYVGLPHSVIMEEEGLALEEYLEINEK